MTTACRANVSLSTVLKPDSFDGGGVGEPPRAMIFDFGDTLVRFAHIDKRALFEQAAWRTYRMWAERQSRMPGFRRYYLHQAFAMRWAFAKTMVLRRELDALGYLQRACRKLWLQAPREFFDELMWQWYRPLVDRAEVEPDAEATLDRLRASGCRLGLISNTFLPGFVMDRHLEKLGLKSYFPVRVYSSEVRYRKPDVRIFQAALLELGVSAEQAIYVGDTFEQDVVGARRAGMRAVWKPIDGVNGHRHQREAAVIERLGELAPA